jgi:hypothetical protein
MPACFAGSPTLGPSLVKRLNLSTPPYLGVTVVAAGVVVTAGVVVVGLGTTVVVAAVVVVITGTVVVVGVVLLQAPRASTATNKVAIKINRPFFTILSSCTILDFRIARINH